MLDTPVPEADGCVVSKSAWNRMLQNFEAETILVQVSSHADDKSWILHVHSYHTLDENVIFLPQRCYDELHHQPSDVVVELVEEDDMPLVATKIVLQPVDNSSEGIDIAKAVSEYLSSWHVLSSGTVLHVPIEELGGFIVDIVVQEVEPVHYNGYVLLRGEVPLELAEPLIRPERPPTPHPKPVDLSKEDEESKEPQDWTNILPQHGNPVVSTKPVAKQETKQKGYVPFGGVGRRLCDS